MSDTNLSTTGAAPAAEPTGGVPDFDAMSREEIQAYIESLEPADDADAGQAAATETDGQVEGDTQVEGDAAAAEEPKEEEQPADEVPAEPVPDLKDFKFTENADPEVRAAEEAKIFEQFELEAPIAEMIRYRDQQIQELQARVEAAPQAADAEYVTAFEEMVTAFKEQEPGVMVPNTDKFRDFLLTKYPKEADQLFIDWNSAPSDKYPGLRKYHEIMMDGFGIDRQGLDNVQAVIENGGRFPLPSFVPEGIDVAALEAYWTHPRRDQIDNAVLALQADLADPTLSDADREAARRDLAQINHELRTVQKGLDADRRNTEAQQQARVHERQQILEEGFRSATDVLVNLLEVESQAIANHLAATMDGPAADLGSGAVMALIQNAFEDNNQYATWAQKKLESVGIKTDWKRAKADIDTLYELETKLVAQKKAGANTVAIEKTNRERAAVIKQLKSYAKELRGHATQKMLTGSAKALQKKVAAAPKIPGARPKATAAAGKALPSQRDFSQMSLEEIRSYTGLLRRQQMGLE